MCESLDLPGSFLYVLVHKKIPPEIPEAFLCTYKVLRNTPSLQWGFSLLLCLLQ
nr:MAG TPA: hypothetical protein [Caudoviricetes sp.]